MSSFNDERSRKKFHEIILGDEIINKKLKLLFQVHTEKFEVISRTKFQKEVPKSWLNANNDR